MPDYLKMFDLTGKTAVVLGAASGIGKASAEAIGALGASVLCADRDIDGAKATAAVIGARAHATQTDATERDAIFALAQHATDVFGSVDIAVTTPGLNIRKLILDLADDEFDQMIELNLKGTFHFFRAFGPGMMARHSGSIIACSSMRAVTIEPGLGVYAATKAGIAQLVKAFAAEVGRHGVRVNAVMPSIIETPLTAPLKAKRAIYDTYAAHTVFNRWGSPSEVGSAVAFLASDAASYMSGCSLVVDGGWTAIDGPPTGLTETAR